MKQGRCAAAVVQPTLYQFAECHECGLVRRLLRQYNVPFEAVTLPAGDKSLVRAKFASDSVPVYVQGPFRSNDLAEICRHIEATYAPRPATAQRGPPSRR